jgi:hypothetical protein
MTEQEVASACEGRTRDLEIATPIEIGAFLGVVPQLLDDTEAWQRRDSSSTRNKKYEG